MTQYEVDISINDADTGKEVLRVTVTRESVAAALHGAAMGAETILKALTSGSGVLVVPPELTAGAKIPTDKAYCLTHDLMWNAVGHDAQPWCSTREATQQEIDGADLAVEDREFTTEPAEIEQMEQRVVGVDLVEGKPPTVVEGVVRDGVLHIGVPRGTDPNQIAALPPGAQPATYGPFGTLPKEMQAARAADLGQMIRDGIIYRHPQGSLSEGDDRIYGPGH